MASRGREPITLTGSLTRGIVKLLFLASEQAVTTSQQQQFRKFGTILWKKAKKAGVHEPRGPTGKREGLPIDEAAES